MGKRGMCGGGQGGGGLNLNLILNLNPIRWAFEMVSANPPGLFIFFWTVCPK
jgi:hypothetical protein